MEVSLDMVASQFEPLDAWLNARRLMAPSGRGRGRGSRCRSHRAEAREGSATEKSRHRLLQPLVDPVEEAGGREPPLVGADEEGEVLGHSGSKLTTTESRDPGR
jgi:hypothetical protein